MAIGSEETAYVNLHDGTGGSSETGVNSTTDDTGTGAVDGLSDLVDTNGDSSGVSISCDDADRVANGTGVTQTGGSAAENDIFAEGMYLDTDASDYDWQAQFTTGHADVRVRFYTGTTFDDQTLNECYVEGVLIDTVDASDPPDPQDVGISAGYISPDGSDNLDIYFQSDDQFFFLNGFSFESDTYASSGGVVNQLQTSNLGADLFNGTLL